MWKRLLNGLSVVCLIMGIAAGARADVQTDSVVAELRAQGYAKITLTRTWLGRVLIIGSTAEGQREIVINPNTGEILRDYFRPRIVVADDGDGGATTTRPLVDGGNPRPNREPSRPNRTPSGGGGGNGGGGNGGGAGNGGNNGPGGNDTGIADEGLGPTPIDVGDGGGSAPQGEVKE